MYYCEPVPIDWFHGRSPYYPPRRQPPPMSRPISKSFNRISDFIFPDSIHVGFHPQESVNRRYHRTDNYSLPLLNRHHVNQHDFIIVERVPTERFDNIELLYREEYHQPNQQVRRRYSSIIDERGIPSTGLVNRSVPYRDRRKRHTTDNAYHSMLKSMLEKDQDRQYSSRTIKTSNYPLSYRMTLEPITDSESMASLHEQENYSAHNRVPINGTTIPITMNHERRKVRQHSSSISSRDSSTDTDITERRILTTNNIHYQQNSSIWERLPLNDVQQQQQQQHERFNPINSSFTDTNNRMNSSPFDNVINYQINNQISVPDTAHDISLCVNDLRTTLFINEDALNNNKSINNGGKAMIKTFIDRIIKRLQHFKRSLDHGLIHVRKANTRSIVTTDHEITKTHVTHEQSWNYIDENKSVRPYFLIRPQTVLMLPNETAKFKCCFGGDPFPTLIWSHNESRIPEILAAGGMTSTRYQMHKLHDIHYLDIGPIKLSDSGQIKCTLMNRFDREEAIAQLLVVASPADGTPRIVQPLNDTTIIEGQPLKLYCGINGLQVIVNWFHNGKLISPSTPMKSDYHDENSTFTLSSCLKSDAGTVDCLVKNRFGEARSSCRIEVVNDSIHLTGE